MNKKRPKKRQHDNSNASKIFELCRHADPNKENVHVDWDKIIERYSQDSINANLNTLPEYEPEDTSDYVDSSDSESDEEIETRKVEGQPNVGKSTIINSLMGKTVVSSSRTPGHTKHFQTIHISETLRLCDCPGLVFPCFIDRPLQILMGLYNIAQVQEPYSSILYLAERVPVEKILSLTMPDTTNSNAWSAWNIAESYAIDRGFYTSRAARPDTYRAGLAILKLCLDGRILLSFKPPGYYSEENKYLKLKIQDEYAERKKAYTHNKKAKNPNLSEEGGRKISSDTSSEPEEISESEESDSNHGINRPVKSMFSVLEFDSTS
ncbi:Guanine nucleotide-binding protein-like 1 [Smittium culicis]|uniref:Guanine nucleotide-binding protein-like 1 n=1 Tax=Smittium culicis TaxID=133412 RepID=A0A1R1Y240_9FUNG|nr:Guanine nucleotide-binding protein-like 1 [Smittium culicis]